MSEESDNKSNKESGNESDNESNKKSDNESIEEIGKVSNKKSTKKLTKELIKESTKKSNKESVNKSNKDSIDRLEEMLEKKEEEFIEDSMKEFGFKTNWYDKNKFNKILTTIDSSNFNHKNVIGKFKFNDTNNLINNIKNNTISEANTKKKINELNDIKKQKQKVNDLALVKRHY